MKTLPRAMTCGEEDRAARLADECARTLLAYYRAESFWNGGEPVVLVPVDTRGMRDGETVTVDVPQPPSIDETWSDHEAAVDQFEEAFPRLEWRDFVEPSLLKAIEENQP